MADDKKSSAQPSLLRVISKSVTGYVNLGVAGTAAVGAAALHSWPLLAVGGAAWAALVAWDVVNPKFWKKAHTDEPEADLPSPSKISDPAVKEALAQILAAREERERVLAETPDQVKVHLAVALAQLGELEERGGRLIARAEALFKYLSQVNPEPIRKEMQRLREKAQRARDKEARAQYESALTAREEQIRALDDIADARERVAANLSRIAATLESLPAKVVRMRALDAQAMDALSGDVNHELEMVNGEVKMFEETLKSLAEIGAPGSGGAEQV